tara:strand:+ start:143 stop:415 length:273 start_codon:yes stop_codon:yes gene_type:complete
VSKNPLLNFYKTRNLFHQDGNITRADKLFFINRAFKWTQEMLRDQVITDKQFSQYIYMLMAYNRGEIDLFFNDKGHLDFSKEEEESHEGN